VNLVRIKSFKRLSHISNIISRCLVTNREWSNIIIDIEVQKKVTRVGSSLAVFNHSVSISRDDLNTHPSNSKLSVVGMQLGEPSCLVQGMARNACKDCPILESGEENVIVSRLT